MKYTVYTQPGCGACESLCERLRSRGHEVEVLTFETLSKMEDIDRRNHLMALIHNRDTTEVPILFANDEIIAIRLAV